MVVSGTIDVSASINGVAQPKESAGVTVTARGWSWGPAQWSFSQGGALANCSVAEPTPGVAVLLGWNTNLNACSGGGGRYLPDLTANPHAGFDIARVTSGPNEGLWYVTAVHYYMERGSNLNQQIMPDAPKRILTDPTQAAECRAAMGLPAGTPVEVNFYIFNETCKGIDVDAWIAALWMHEGFGSAGSNGHESVARIEAAKPEYDPYAGADTLTSKDEHLLRSSVSNMAWDRNLHVSNQAASHQYVTGNWTGNLTYWMWDPAGSRYVPASLPPGI
jgi:hypothetical protein